MGFSAVMAGIGLLGTAISSVGAYNQAAQQKAQAEYQAQIAQQNQQLAEEQASAERRQGYENAIAKRQEAARIIGQQRALAGGSGAQVDAGGFLDLQMDTAERGEIDALNAQQQGFNAAYQSELQAWNYGNRAAAFQQQADQINPMWAAGSTALGGVLSVGAGYGSQLWKGGGAGTSGSGLAWSQTRRAGSLGTKTWLDKGW